MLLWHLDFDDEDGNLQRLFQKRAERGNAVPEPPELLPHLTWVWSAFNTLSETRTNSGFGVSPITLEAFSVYCALMHIADSERLELFDLLRAMDRAFMKWCRKDKDHGRNSSRN